MPNKKEPKRNYDITDGDLIQDVDAVIGFVARDAAEFAGRGVDNTDDVQADRDAFADFPTDEELAADVSTAAAEKETVKAELLDLVDPIRNMAEQAFGLTSSRYKSFGFAGLINMRDGDIHRTVKRIHRRATANLAALTPHGLTPAMLAALAAKNDLYDQKLDAVIDAEADRDEQTEERIALGNALFAKYSRLCSIGKSIWQNTSEAKYNDYVMDPAGNGNNQPDPGTGGGTDE